MKLFEINELFEVELNKEWIMMIPEFNELVKRDKGSDGDYRGQKKLRTRRELSYIYFLVDFHSPIRDFEEEKKEEEALKFCRLEAKDIDAKVLAALELYKKMQYENAPSLRTLDALKIGMSNLDKYFREVDFDKVDKQGKLKYTPKEYIDNIKSLPKMRTAIKEFEIMVQAELRENTGFRGNASMGLMAGKRNTLWEETAPPDGDPENSALATTDI